MSLKIVVLAKQVPDTRNVGKDAMTAEGTVNRAALPAIFNPEDLNALEQALRIKEQNPGTTVGLLTMGPPRAGEIIREGLYRGADTGWLLTDRLFAGADTLATSYALATAIKKIGDVDLVIGGRQAIDGDTAQVGPEMAEHLGLPQVSYVTDARKEGDRLVVRKESEESVQTLEVEGPCVLTVLASAFSARYMSVSGIMEAYGREVELWSADRIDVDEERLGLKGSPTKVFQSFPKALKAPGEQFEGSAEEAVELIVRKLKEKHII